MENKEVEKWTCEDVRQWLSKLGLTDNSSFDMAHKHHIDGPVLLMLTEEDLRQPPLELKRLGDIKRVAHHIRKLQISCSQYPPLSASKENIPPLYQEEITLRSRRARHGGPVVARYSGGQFSTRRDSTESEDVELYRRNSMRSSRQQTSSFNFDDIPLELWKTVLSFVYVFAVFMLTAFVMVVVHDRVPEMDKYPPLPDLFLDNMPHVPWAFDACEIVGLTLGVMWFILLFFHKHRFVLMRRFFSLMGTIFLLRCVTMLITSLSVPGKHLQCSGKRYGDWYTRLQRTFEIWQGMGMSLQGVRSCGDYMFSGHTSVITLLTFFITEYTPRKYYYVHIMSWCLNLFGIFFLLAAHEHYSIDVFVAFYLSSRLFMYYHTLAHNRALQAADARRTRIWFPLFAFFESKCEGRIPNTFEVPLRNPVQSFKNLVSYVSRFLSDRNLALSNLRQGQDRKGINTDVGNQDEDLTVSDKVKLK